MTLGPVEGLVVALTAGRLPSLAWTVAMQRYDSDPVRGAWQRETIDVTMRELLFLVRVADVAAVTPDELFFDGTLARYGRLDFHDNLRAAFHCGEPQCITTDSCPGCLAILRDPARIVAPTLDEITAWLARRPTPRRP